MALDLNASDSKRARIKNAKKLWVPRTMGRDVFPPSCIRETLAVEKLLRRSHMFSFGVM